MIDVKVEDSGLNINVSIEGSGPPGKAGEDGVSPTVDVTETENGHKVTITDKDGAKSFEVANGTDGADGADGKSPYVGENGHWFEWQDGKYVDTGKVAEGRNGDDGVSPTVEVTQTGTGHKVVITDKDGAKSFDVNNGQNGEDGEDGVSPTIAVEDVEGGHKVIITGAAGPKEFVVLNGKNGDPGDPGENGQTPSITIGTVETLPADSPATAEIVGQTPNLTMNLGIPKGPKGEDGTKGDLPDTSNVPDGYALLVQAGIPVWGEIAGVDKWRLIRNITLQEEAVGFSFDKDESNQPFSLRKLLIVGLTYPNEAGDTAAYIDAIFNNNVMACKIGTAAGGSGEEWRAFMGVFDTIAGMMLPIDVKNSSNGSSVKSELAYSVSYSSGGALRGASPNNDMILSQPKSPCTSIRVTSWRKIGNGSRLIVWGVDA